MNNLILHLLSNRPGPFLTPLFGQEPTFVPQTLSTVEQALRGALLLDRTNTDYYLKIYLAVLNAYPDWKQQFGSNLAESYAIEELLPKGVYMQGGDLVGLPGGPGLFTDPPVNALPVELHYRISYLSDNLCQIVGMETQVRYNATVATTGDDPQKLIRITWPAAVPFVGPLRLTQMWTLGAVIDIFVQPSYFPFATLISEIRGNFYLQSLLASYGITSDFNESKDPMEQTAMVLTVLGLTNLVRMQTDQFGQPLVINSDVAGWLTEQPA